MQQNFFDGLSRFCYISNKGLFKNSRSCFLNFPANMVILPDMQTLVTILALLVDYCSDSLNFMKVGQTRKWFLAFWLTLLHIICSLLKSNKKYNTHLTQDCYLNHFIVLVYWQFSKITSSHSNTFLFLFFFFLALRIDI